jgi:hypothetical protein
MPLPRLRFGKLILTTKKAIIEGGLELDKKIS